MKRRFKDILSYSVYLIKKHGILGRKMQVLHFLSLRDKNTGYNVRKAEIYVEYKKICNQYTKIRVHRLWSTRIGEYLVRYLVAVEDAENNVKEGILDVFVLSDCINHNTRLSQIMKRNIQIIDETNIDMWLYILRHFPKVEFIKSWSKYDSHGYIYDNDHRLFNSVDTVRYFRLTQEEELEGQYKKKLMGLNGEFVCISSRDSAYLATVLPSVDCSYHNHRDSNINYCNLSADYLSQKRITMVRMGRHVKNKVNFNNCIDYANKYYDELMDIILMKECKFYLGDISGLSLLPVVFNKPSAYKNVVPVFCQPFEANLRNPQNIMIFKKYYSKKEDRFLSIKEMMKVEQYMKSCGHWGDAHLYEKLEIEVIENTPEEILDLVIEMNTRIDGEWIDSPEDVELQRKYQEIVQNWCAQGNLNENAIFYGKVGTMFLRKNPFLLD